MGAAETKMEEEDLLCSLEYLHADIFLYGGHSQLRLWGCLLFINACSGRNSPTWAFAIYLGRNNISVGGAGKVCDAMLVEAFGWGVIIMA